LSESENFWIHLRKVAITESVIVPLVRIGTVVIEMSVHLGYILSAMQWVPEIFPRD